MMTVSGIHLTRRGVLGLCGAGATLGCAHKKSTGYGGHLFVANRDDQTVAAVNLRRFAISRRIPLGAAPEVVLGHPTAGLVYVLAPAAGTLYELDAAGIRRKLWVAPDATDMRMAPDGKSLWILCQGAQALVRVPLDTMRPAGRIRLPQPAVDFDLSRDGVATCAFPGAGQVGLAGKGERAMTRLTPVPGGPSIVRFRSDGLHVLAGSRESRTITAVDAVTGGVVVRLPVAVEPRVFCFNADQGQLFVSGPGADAVALVYPYRTEVAETILAGKAPGALATCDNPAYLFAANPESAGITVLDIETHKLIALVGVGQEPSGILITPDRQYALVLNRGSGDVAIIRIATLPVDSDGRPRRYKAAPLFHMVAVGAGPVSGAIVAG